jgi:hypothetical protein
VEWLFAALLWQVRSLDPLSHRWPRQRFEVVRGKYEKPERKTWLDTRKLGEGQDIEEFRDERKKIRDEQRWREIKDETR